MVFVKQTQKGVADEGEVGHQIGIAAAGAVFAAKGIAAPVVAIFYSAPVAADEVDPAFVRALRRLLTREVVSGFEGGFAGLFLGATALHCNQSTREGKVDGDGFDWPQDQAALFDSPVTGLGLDKRGGSPSH